MDTWNLFSGSDIALAVLGLVGFASVVIVVSTASSRVNNRELTLRRNAQRAQSNASDS